MKFIILALSLFQLNSAAYAACDAQEVAKKEIKKSENTGDFMVSNGAIYRNDGTAIVLYSFYGGNVACYMQIDTKSCESLNKNCTSMLFERSH